MIYFAKEFTDGSQEDMVIAHYSYNYRETSPYLYDWSTKKIMLAVIQPG